MQSFLTGTVILLSLSTYFPCPLVFPHIITMSHNLFSPSHSNLVYLINVVIIWHTFSGTWLAETLSRVRSDMTKYCIVRVRSDDSSRLREVCHAWHTELPDILAVYCHSSSAQVQWKILAPHVTLPTQVYQKNTCRRAPLHRKCMQRQTLYFHESHRNSDSFVRCVKLLFCLIFHFKRNLMLGFIKIAICWCGCLCSYIM